MLLAEDDPVVATMFRLGLEHGGCSVTVAGDGEQAALLALGGEGFDALVLDLGLPRKDGLEVLALLRDRLAASQLPVVVLSNRSGDFGTAMRLGADPCLTKSSTSPSLLLKHVESAIGRNRPAYAAGM